jgi:carboxypeptidase C (cathepsin A)
MTRTLLIAAALLACLSARAADDGAARPPMTETAKSAAAEITLNGQPIRYRATAGTLVLRDEAGEPTASLFYVAYVADRRPGAPERPVTFLYNGGPGSASLWLNVGGFGPRHAVTAAPAPTGAPPYRLEPNPESLLDKTDLVFLDAVGTGYSRPLGKAEARQFWGVDQDVDAYAQAIIRYITINDRWNSPKFLFGESYGTTRSAALAYRLHVLDVDLNGVILLSSILNFADLEPGLDQGDIDLLPTYAAAAWYHHRAAQPAADLAGFLDQARAFAAGPYARALAQGDAISDAELNQVAAEMSRFIGLPAEDLARDMLRVDMERFRKELLKDQGKVIGRFDARFTAQAPGATGHFDPATDDPATAGVSSAYLTAFRHHLSADIGYASDLYYRALFNAVIEPAWDWHHKAPGIDHPLSNPDTALDLAAAMQANPAMKILSLNGLFDLATPFFGAETDLSHMLLAPELRGNVERRYYQTGHMAYTDPAALKAMKRDLARFYDAALPR